MFIIVLGRHVSILIESSSGPSKKIDPCLKYLKMRCGIPNAYIIYKTMYKMHVSFCCAIYGLGLRSLACWDGGLVSRPGHGCLF